jgi:DNA replication and repair protein RecF
MLRKISLRDFRNFERLDAEIPEAGIAIIGENGHGKTNLLEAVSYLALLRSMRGARDADVIRFGAAAFHVRAELADDSRLHDISVAYERSTKRKKVLLDGVEHPRLSDALAALPSVCFSPIDVVLVGGGPAERRRFLDVTLALSEPRYLAALQQFRAALRQRNAALRDAMKAGGRNINSHESRVAVWEPMLVAQGAKLAAARFLWCQRHASTFTELCASIGERAPVAMRYVSVLAASNDGGAEDMHSPEHTVAQWFADAYERAFAEQRNNELRRGITLVGPHRDDLHLSLGNRDLRTFGSAGQQRTAAIALRMLELATLRDAIGRTPLLLLDDPFAELDARRASRILQLLEERGVGQVLLAVPREQDIPPTFTRLERRTMQNGSMQ